MSASVRDEIIIDAEPEAVMAVITDVGAYPEWQEEIKESEVLETDEDGRTRRAQLTVDARIMRTTYTLVYSYTPRSVSWELEEGDQLNELTGSYTLDDLGAGSTRVAYDLVVEPKMRVPGLVRREAARRIADEALNGLKRRVETGA